MMDINVPDRAEAPMALNHVVLNVRDMEESHRFWTEIIGFRHVATAKPRPDRPVAPNMRLYSCDHGGGRMSRHDLALVENAPCRRRQRNGRWSACRSR